MARASNKPPGSITIPAGSAPGNGEGAGVLLEPGAPANPPQPVEWNGELETWGGGEAEGLDLFRETGDAAVLSDSSFSDWSWQVYRLRTPDELSRERRASPTEWMMRLDGPLELNEIQRQCGGGTFVIWGYFAKRLRCRFRQPIGGARMTFATQAAAPAPAAAPAAVHQYAPQVSRDDGGLSRVLETQGRLLERIAAKLESPAPAPAPAMGVADVLALADRLNQRDTPNPSGEVLKELVGAFKMGMDIRQDATGGPAKSTAEIALEKFAPVLEKIALGFLSRGARPAGPPRRAAGPGAGSRAEVVDTPTAAPAAEPAAPEPDPDGHRWPAVVEALANAIARGDDPAAFVDTLELLLPPQDLGMLRLAPADVLVAQLRAQAGGRYEILNTEQAAAFIQAVLAELNQDGSEGPA